MTQQTEKVAINNRSIETAGLTTDYKEAISQFIWNGFEAQATEIKVIFDNTQELGFISEFTIRDNGTGIDYDDLKSTFGSFLDSLKKRNKTSTYIHGGKGKGRFSFQVLASSAIWDTCYKKEGKTLEYKIKINASNKDEYDILNPPSEKTLETGTSVTFQNILKLTAFQLDSDDLKDFLKAEFGWFLHLNKAKSYQILINDEKLDYDSIIESYDEKMFSYKDKTGGKTEFKINYIEWNKKIGEDYFFYFLNSNKDEIYREHTSFNRKSDGYHHSLYIESSYFDSFISSNVSEQSSLLGNSTADDCFKDLIKFLKSFLEKKRKAFYKKNSVKILKKFETDKSMPVFAKNKYDQERKKDFEAVLTEMYTIEPKIFIGLNVEQQRSFLGFLNLLLDTDERENILKIIESITDLEKKERESLVDLLKKTSFSKIVQTIKMIESRFIIIERLKLLVLELTKFTTERGQIQEIIKDNHWLFGEEYTNVTCDESFENSLYEYAYALDGSKNKEDYKMASSNKKKRLDIFLCSQRAISSPDYSNINEIEENIIVELKRPSVPIGKIEFRQVDDYKDIILKEPRFHSELRVWKFFLVSTKVDDVIKEKYKTFKDKGRRFLVDFAENCEIYAMTWTDLFKAFDIKHKYLLNKLNFDKTALEEELNLKGIELSTRSTKKITAKILASSDVASGK